MKLTTVFVFVLLVSAGYLLGRNFPTVIPSIGGM